MAIKKFSIKNIFLTALMTSFAFLIVFSFSKPYEATAIGSQYFGGMKTATFQCTCSGNQLIYVQDYASNKVLALVYDKSVKLFSNNNIYGTYLLGSYSSGGQCKYQAGEECVEMKSDGKLNSNPGTGTS